jgi:lysophospholipase L1-like esterase
MNTLLKKSAPALALLGLALGSCQPELDAPKADAGSLNFNNYVAVGNSLTAGYSDGGLYNEVMRVSYPALLAQQFGKTNKGPASFVIPLFDEQHPDGSGYAKFAGFTASGSPILQQPSPANSFLGEKVAYTGSTTPSVPNELIAYTGPQPDNLGVPGISVLSADRTASSVPQVQGAAAAYGSLNNFYNRLLTPAERTSKDYVTYIGQKNPTFFSCWMGNNDVLTYATNGGVAAPGNPFAGLTDTTSFGRGYRNIVRTISKNGTVPGVVANIPNVTNVPYFTTVRVADIIASIKANPNLPNASAASLYITTGTGTVREATSADLLTLVSSGVIGTTSPTSPLPVGVGYSATQANPLPSQFVLDATEAASVQTRTTQLNGIIAKTALQYKVPVADMNTFFGNIAANGYGVNATTNSASFLSGNLFSLDGVHPTPRGYAVVANEFIRTINTYYKTSVPFVNPNEYRGIIFP